MANQTETETVRRFATALTFWQNKVKKIESTYTSGWVLHKARMYYNPLSTCYPEKVNPG